MKKKEVSNWDLIVKLLDDNESEIHMKRYIFHEEVSESIKRMKDTKVWYEKLIEEYQKGGFKMTKEEAMAELKLKDDTFKTEPQMGSNFSDVGYTMSISELVNKLKALKDDDNWDTRHEEADNLLLEFINIQVVKDAFDDLEKFYS